MDTAGAACICKNAKTILQHVPFMTAFSTTICTTCSALTLTILCSGYSAVISEKKYYYVEEK
jgi:hypothetical protein